MTTMQDREKAFEAKFALDEELKFKAVARRNKLLGLWAAGLLNRADADAYAQEVVAADLEEAGHEDVVRKIKADFDVAGVAQTEDEIRVRMLEFLAEAIEQVKNT
ncbi:MAG TPA: ATPase inhibitor subunit zeta [Sinorhizobium sp.]|nr:ATPase inhibitor subunit zeta [Sinorhizobium sp.]